ncbi:hypothetical protein MGU_08908 [Metarhizium guizhouense ARSEF 977]|uniref:Uncharacterized protein n=1 Tax=Metarhizium guizhouense (strain ARSEF 977) TaxID=1276136 RepID=A0A0B4GMK5_METGA|nr:hypothetical protein MGU_08908 [Metarhizium guizhouense ARSEF 977]
MLLPTAGFLVLCALQPALGQAPAECSSNRLLFKKLTPDEIVMGYDAKNTGCDAGVKAWVGVWGANAALKTDFKAWKYLEANEGEVRFNKTELGNGQWKAAFVCEDGWRIPFLMSDNFELGGHATCTVRREHESAVWITWTCDEYQTRGCQNCVFAGLCDACNECARQCGKPGHY